MIISRLSGGLGNQMFQYALGRSLAIKNKAPLKLDITPLGPKEVNGRQYSLGIFNIAADLATDEEISVLLKNGDYRRHLWSNRISHKFFDFTAGHRPNLIKNKFIIERRTNFDQKVLSAADPVYLNGHWQSEKYFQDIAEIIKKDFRLRAEYALSPNVRPWEDEIKNQESVAIHVRRGDYVSNPSTNQYHGVCGLDYYLRAVEIIKKRVINPVFFIFSDDVPWCRKNFADLSPVNYVSGLPNYHDLMLMSVCRHNIIANSSFSWWGAWLNNNPHKIVIAPQRWFNDPRPDSSDLVPANWLKI